MARVHKLDAELKALPTMSPARLKQYWSSLSGVNLTQASPSLLRHLIAQRLQENAFGKLPVQLHRELDRLGGQNGATAATPPRHGPILPGTRFVREWNGKTIAVTASDCGFEWDNKTYRSLSQVAHAVTGAHWSGPRFFGLTSMKARHGSN